MADAVTQSFGRLFGRSAGARRGAARSLLRRDLAWSEWLTHFNATYVTAPEREAVAAKVLAEEAARLGDEAAAARFRLLEARALQRGGSADAAVRAYRRAERELRASGDRQRAAQAQVLCVDALAVAGQADEALACARDAARRLRGPQAPAWRAALKINKANALRLHGDVASAVRDYEAAARALDAQEQAHTAAIARFNAGVALMDAGDAEAARRRFEVAVAGFERAEQPDLALEARYNLACALVRCGDLGQGLRRLDALAGEHRERGLERREALCRMDLADALRRAGDHGGAEREALESARLFARSGARAEQVEALWLAAEAAPEARRATRHLARASTAAGGTGRPALALRCDLLRWDRAIGRGRLPGAGDVARIRRAALRRGQQEIAAQAALMKGQVALARGDAGSALRVFSLPELSRRGRPWIRLAAQTGRARAEAQLGRPGAAIRRLRDAARFLDAVRAELPGAWLRTTFVLERLDPYLQRIELLLARGRRVDRREAEALLDALAARRFLESRRPPRPRGRLARLRRRLEAIYDRLARGDGPTRGLVAPDLARLERQARALERQVAEAWKAAERRAAAARRVDTVTPRSAPLPEHAAAVHVWVAAGGVRALVRRGDEISASCDLGTLASLHKQVDLLGFHARRRQRLGSRAGGLETSLAELSARLLDPLGAATWPRDVRLVLDGRLPDLPWELLPAGARHLCSDRSLLRVPALRVRPRPALAARGTQVVALGEPDLPGVLAESLAVADAGDVLAGAGARRDAVVRALRERAVVHFAGHGYDAPEAPTLGGVRVADGWFSAADVPRRIGARLVVLSACRTGPPGGVQAQAWGGLPTALLSAGARCVVWTSADVEDASAAELMSRFHAERSGLQPPVAFGRALDAVAQEQGHAANLLRFHVSGIPQ